MKRDRGLEWRKAFAADVIAYYKTAGQTQKWLADQIGWSLTGVNKPLKHPEKMTENFIRSMAEHVPYFASSYREYLQARDAEFRPVEEQAKAAAEEARRRQIQAVANDLKERLAEIARGIDILVGEITGSPKDEEIE